MRDWNGYFYAVAWGVVPGVYLNWADCKAMVDGYPDNDYKRFDNLKDAVRFVRTHNDGLSQYKPPFKKYKFYDRYGQEYYEYDYPFNYCNSRR